MARAAPVRWPRAGVGDSGRKWRKKLPEYRGYPYNHAHRFSYQSAKGFDVPVLRCRCGFVPVWTVKEIREIDKRAAELKAMFLSRDGEHPIDA